MNTKDKNNFYIPPNPPQEVKIENNREITEKILKELSDNAKIAVEKPTPKSNVYNDKGPVEIDVSDYIPPPRDQKKNEGKYMKKALSKKFVVKLYNDKNIYGDKSNIFGNARWIYGNCSKITGDVSRISGCVSNLSGDVSRISGCVNKIYGFCSNIFGNIKYYGFHTLRGNVSNLNGNIGKLWGNCSHIFGMLNLEGDVSYISGDVSNIHGKVSSGFRYVKGKVDKIYGDITHISGDVSNISGCVSRMYGDCTSLEGNLDDCQIPEDRRTKGIDVKNLISMD